jgi:cobalt/nickel transport system permease protein
MHVHFLDPYHPKESIIHRLDPRIKLGLTLAFILTTAMVPIGSWPIYTFLFAIILAIEALSELGIGYVLKRSLLALPFVLAAIPIIFTASGQELANFTIGSMTLSISQAGLERFISISLKSWISVQAAIVLATCTPFPEILVAMRAIRLPRLIVAIFSLMWRYLFVLVDEAIRLNRARASRSGIVTKSDKKVGGSIVWRARVTGGMVGSLFLRALERSDRIYMAMVSRGYDGEIRSLPLPALNFKDWIILLSCLILFGLLLLLSFLF